MGGKTRYSDEYRSIAVTMLKALGWPEREGALAEVARHLGMKDGGRTLSRWAKGEQNPPPDYLVEEKTAELSELLDQALRSAIKSLPSKLDDASYRDTATAIGIFTDKLQLLNDKPTQNVKSAIIFDRRGISTLPEHLASGTDESAEGEAEI